MIGLFLAARLQVGRTLAAAAALAALPGMPYQRGQFWVRRFQRQAPALCAALVAWTTPVAASGFVLSALQMLQSIGWIAAHRLLLADLRVHLLGWPQFLAPAGRAATLRPAPPPG